MKSLRSQNDYVVKKITYTVESTRPAVGEDCNVTITLDGKEIHHERRRCKSGFGSGLCRNVFAKWLKTKKN